MKPFHRNPIVEALCEVRFEPTEAWDISVFASFYDAIKEEFTEKPQHQITYPPNGSVDEASAPPPPILSVLFRSADGKRVVQLMENVLTVNLVGKGAYTSWVDFREFILQMTHQVLRASKATSVSGVSLRYVNRFDQTPQAFEPSRYYHVYPHVPESMRGDWGQYVLRMQLPAPPPEQLTVFNVAFLENETVASVLDITSAVIDTVTPEEGRLAEVLELGHGRIESAFLASITPTAERWLNGEDV